MIITPFSNYPIEQVLPMETLDIARERELICDSFAEARRAIRLRFEHATTDRLRTLVTLGTCVGLHYSGHGDPNYLSMEDGRGGAHFVQVRGPPLTACMILNQFPQAVLDVIRGNHRCNLAPALAG